MCDNDRMNTQAEEKRMYADKEGIGVGAYEPPPMPGFNASHYQSIQSLRNEQQMLLQRLTYIQKAIDALAVL